MKERNEDKNNWSISVLSVCTKIINVNKNHLFIQMDMMILYPLGSCLDKFILDVNSSSLYLPARFFTIAFKHFLMLFKKNLSIAMWILILFPIFFVIGQDWTFYCHNNGQQSRFVFLVHSDIFYFWIQIHTFAHLCGARSKSNLTFKSSVYFFVHHNRNSLKLINYNT